MSATTTSALVEEAETMAVRALDGTAGREEKSALFASLAATLRRAETDRDAALQQSAAWEIQAQDMRDRLIKAEAERDAQHAEVLRLQKERDAAIAMEADTARRSSAEIDSLKAELNEARGEVENLNRRVEELCGQRDKARAQIATLELMRRGGQ